MNRFTPTEVYAQFLSPSYFLGAYIITGDGYCTVVNTDDILEYNWLEYYL